jgi:hypothetical protein
VAALTALAALPLVTSYALGPYEAELMIPSHHDEVHAMTPCDSNNVFDIRVAIALFFFLATCLQFQSFLHASLMFTT